MKKGLFFVFILFIVLSSFGFEKKKWDKEKIKENLLEEGYYTISDTLLDVDGDKIQDLIITTSISIMYPLFSFVYLGSIKEDSTEYVFANPTYSTDENIVRCVYGDSEYFGDDLGGYMILEKYKWTRERLDTLEQYFIRNTIGLNNFGNYKNHKAINKEQIPAEYKTINGFDFYYRFVQKDINKN